VSMSERGRWESKTDFKDSVATIHVSDRAGVRGIHTKEALSVEVRMLTPIVLVW
jgi:hypothetical protein